MKLITLFFICIASVAFAQSNLTKIAGGYGEKYMAPLYSPDGTMLAFTSDNYKGIWIYRFSDQSIKQLTDETASGFGFSWSYDSKYILSRVAEYEGIKRLNAVKVFNIETGESENLSGYHSNMPVLPQWTYGDSKVFAYTGSIEFYTTGRTARRGASPKTAFVKDNKIALADAVSGEVTTIEPLRKAEYINVSLSPDASKIVFEVVGGSIYVINTSGRGLMDLGKGYRPKWAPDSRRIIYMLSEDDGHDITGSEIYVVNTDGTGRRKLTNSEDKIEMNPSFSADGKNITFDDFAEGLIYIMKFE